MSNIIVFNKKYAVYQQNPDNKLPNLANGDGFWTITYTREEISVVCEEEWVPAGVKVEPGWRLMKVKGPLDFSQVGVLSAIAAPLAQVGISVFTISTYDTDYILVKDGVLKQAIKSLLRAGHHVEVTLE